MTGKTAIVTGAAGGIGSAAVAAFQDAGFDVVGIDRDEADLTRADEVERAFATLARLDVLFTAHGMSGRRFGDGPVDQCTDEGWDVVLEQNLKSVFLCCKAAIQRLRENGGGAIVTLASALGLVGGDADFATHAYAASKGGVISLTRAIASYYAPQRIRANVIAPGLIRTAMSRRAQADPDILADLPRLQPLASDFGTPEDVAEAAVYLVSDAAAFVTGVVLPVDGGWTVR